MTVLKLSGEVSCGDGYRCMDDGVEGAVAVDGRDVVELVEMVTWAGPVTFAFGDERWTGDLQSALGWGYSEYTPMDADELFVGAHDILAILEGHAGKRVTVWFADEPFNTLA